MLRLGLDIPEQRPLRVLCVGAHCDDIEIGCGGTILKLLAEPRAMAVNWLVFSGAPNRAQEAKTSAESFLAGASDHSVEIMTFEDSFFPYDGREIKRRFERLKTEVQPDLVFTHHREDLHQDHRLLSELTWNTFRDHLILEYEIPKYDGGLGQPNFFVPLDEAMCRRKSQIICECFESQQGKHWFTEETFLALLRLRGVESASTTGYAEAFHLRKGVLQ